jgi:hypothetical protein
VLVITREFSRNEEKSWWQFWKENRSVRHVDIMFNDYMIDDVVDAIKIYKTQEEQKAFRLKDRIRSAIDQLADQVGFL